MAKEIFSSVYIAPNNDSQNPLTMQFQRTQKAAPLNSGVLRIIIMNQEIEWGLTACGSSGETSIDIDESISGPEIYELEISKSKWYLRFRIANTRVVIELLDFFIRNT
jgi:hypothetical protein